MPQGLLRSAGLALAAFLLSRLAVAQTQEAQPRPKALVEEFTANTLDQGELKVGTQIEYGLSPWAMAGVDAIPLALGIQNLHGKVGVWDDGLNKIGLGAQAALVTRNTLWYGTMADEFSRLNYQVLRPSVHLSRRSSDLFTLHALIATSLFGTREATLTPERIEAMRSQAGPTSRALWNGLDLQALAGLSSSIFQVTGDFERSARTRLLILASITRTALFDLKEDRFTVGVSQQWCWESFNVRFGLGIRYRSLQGQDLAKEPVADEIIDPSADIALYWRLTSR